LDPSNTPLSWYFNVLWESRVVGRQPNTGNRDYYHFDIIGTTRSVTQGSTVVESHDYDPWGLELRARGLGSGTKEGFSGKEQDAETGLDYFGARYYVAALGRWTSVDPMLDGMPEWSPYSYVYDNPASRIDPDGRQVTQLPNGGVKFEGDDARWAFEILKQGANLRQWVKAHSKDPCSGGGPGYGLTGAALGACWGAMAEPIGQFINTAWTLESIVLPLSDGSFVITKLGLTATEAEAAAAGSVWALGWATRGVQIEKLLGKNLPELFPTIDKIVGRVVTSIKSMDLTAPAYQRGGALLRRLTRYLDKLESFTEASAQGATVTQAMYDAKALELAIPAARLTSAQLTALRAAQAYATQKGIKFVVVLVP
jgi:RHS repeat-associated protein